MMTVTVTLSLAEAEHLVDACWDAEQRAVRESVNADAGWVRAHYAGNAEILATAGPKLREAVTAAKEPPFVCGGIVRG